MERIAEDMKLVHYEAVNIAAGTDGNVTFTPTSDYRLVILVTTDMQQTGNFNVELASPGATFTYSWIGLDYQVPALIEFDYTEIPDDGEWTLSIHNGMGVAGNWNVAVFAVGKRYKKAHSDTADGFKLLTPENVG